MPRVRSSNYPFQGRIVAVRVDELVLDDGTVVRQEVVEHRDSVTVVAVDDRGRLLLVRQFRHPTGRELLETPAGSVDPDEAPEEAVNRELAEETGYRARRIEELGGFYLAPGWATEYMRAYLATELYESPADPDEDERIEVVWLAPGEWEERIRTGGVPDAKSLAAWHLAASRLRAPDGSTPDPG